jgi:hypothetical protein
MGSEMSPFLPKIISGLTLYIFKLRIQSRLSI